MSDIFYSLEELSKVNEPVHLALGVFDGVHVGHQAVIQSAIDLAKHAGERSGVLTF